MPDIKTREVVKDIKVLDKASVAGERMRTAYIRTKDGAKHLADDSRDSPTEYAENQIEYAAEETLNDVRDEVEHVSRSTYDKAKQVLRSRRDTDSLSETTSEGSYSHWAGSGTDPHEGSINAPKPESNGEYWGDTKGYSDQSKSANKSSEGRKNTPYSNSNKVRHKENFIQRFGEQRSSQSKSPFGTNLSVSNDSSAHNIKTKPHASGSMTSGSAKTIKASQKSIKTAQRTSKTAVKTTETTAKTAQKTAKAAEQAARVSAQAAKATAEAAKATARAIVVAAKAVAKAAVAATKAIAEAFTALVEAIAAGGWVAVLIIVIICVLGLIVGCCFGIFFASEDTGSRPMNEVIMEINEEYLDRIESIKESNMHDVLEMSGSRAVWPDVLSVYAVKVTTDEENPQEVATLTEEKEAILREIFWEMNEISHSLTREEVTVIVERDDGMGNIIEEETIETKTTLRIVVGHKTAAQIAAEYRFNDEQIDQMNMLLDDDNNELWMAVLYGVFGKDEQIVAVALSQVGNVGGQPYWSWYGFGSRVEWCACFVSWCANECEYIENGIIPKFASCGNGIDWFQARAQWDSNDVEPVPGMLIFFDWDDPGGPAGPQDGIADHVGIVEEVENGRVYTIEGNSNDRCVSRSYPVGWYEIYGYGIPKY